jgi:hypothetical protein
MKKKGQFYLLAVLLILSTVIAIISVKGQTIFIEEDSLNYYKEDLDFQISKILEHITKNNLNETQSKELFANFSTNYGDFLDEEKTAIFIFGKSDSHKNLENYTVLLKNKKEEDNLKIYYLENNENLSEGIINFSIGENFSLSVNDYVYDFYVNEGENIYYMIKHDIKGGSYIIHN